MKQRFIFQRLWIILLLTSACTAVPTSPPVIPAASSTHVLDAQPASPTSPPTDSSRSPDDPILINPSPTPVAIPGAQDPNNPLYLAAYPGYTLFSPIGSTETYLIDNVGQVVHSWHSSYPPGQSVYLLENGHLLRTAALGDNGTFSKTGGAGGRIEEYSWEGELLWWYEYSSPSHLQHHDIHPLPNGNILLIAWESKSSTEAIAAGRDPALITGSSLWYDSIVEVQPSDNSGGQVVWEWHAWDHLVQDYDPNKANYGVVAEHPERIHLNYVEKDSRADWMHVNSIDYNAELDQILISLRNFSEIWIIDHSTTTAEAASSQGGHSGRGGDLLYRWGNPQAYDHGAAADQTLFGQHNATWIPTGYPGAGHILVFNNGVGRPGGNYSSIDEIVPPLNTGGSYDYIPGSSYAPLQAVWIYTASNPADFFADHISGAQRLPNGNTLICDGPAGHFFEVTPSGEIVWEYTNLFKSMERPQANRKKDKGNSVFRAERYELDYAGIRSRLE